MRLLIAIYVLLGLLQASLAAWSGRLGYLALTVDGHRKDRVQRGEEALMIAGIMAACSAILFLVAIGLWRRRRIVYLTLLVLTAFGLVVSTIIGATAAGDLIGLWDSRDGEFNEPAEETLAGAAGYFLYCALHVWVLRRPAVRKSFARRKTAKVDPLNLEVTE